MFIIFCLILLVLTYWKAQVFLKAPGGGREGSDDEILDVIPKEEQELQTQPKAITYAKMKSFVQQQQQGVLDSDTAEEAEEEFTEIIEHATVEISLKFVAKNQYLSGLIDGITGLKDLAKSSSRVNYFRFHTTLLPAKREKFKTGYRSFRELNVNIAFGLGNVKIDDLKTSTLRLRLYGRRIEFGVPVSTEKCLGEIYVALGSYVEKFEKGQEVRSRFAILPKTNQFPKPDDSFT